MTTAGGRGSGPDERSTEGLTYRGAGVDIDAGEALVARIKRLAGRARRPEVVSGIGGFSGLCGLPAGIADPLLVAGTDGVGTKLKSAFATGRHEGVGLDLVAMCVNDVLVTGAEPLFFLDYFATGRLDVDVAETVIAGIAEGCRQAGCALLGGETAELPGMYAEGEYDLAGFCVGVVGRADLRDGRDLAAGDLLVGVASSGLHSNGHSLARKAVLEVLGLGWDARPPLLAGASVADDLLRPTRIYVQAFRALAAAGVRWKGAAHITGGGLVENPPRMVPVGSELGLVLEWGRWPVPPIFGLVASAGLAAGEAERTFNLGLGMVLVVSPVDAPAAIAALEQAGERAFIVGEVERSGTPGVRFVGDRPWSVREERVDGDVAADGGPGAGGAGDAGPGSRSR